MGAEIDPADAVAVGITCYGCSPGEVEQFQSMALGLGVVPTITEAELSPGNIGLAVGNRCISIGHKTRIRDATLVALSQVGVGYVSTRSVGYDHIDVERARNLGITVETVKYSSDSVADFTVMSILMLVRDAKSVMQRVDRQDYCLQPRPARELRDLTVGVIGTGRIGAAVIERLRCFGCAVLASDPRETLAVEYVSIDELVRRSDLVTLHAPLSRSTDHLLNRERIGAMRSGAFVVNTGRGGLLDTDALVRALELGRLGGAALDVLEGEEGVFSTDWSGKPLQNPLLSRLHQLPNVILTPHTAYYTDHALRDMVGNSIVNCLRFEGRVP